MVKSFKYLGITLQTTTCNQIHAIAIATYNITNRPAFTKHINEDFLCENNADKKQLTNCKIFEKPRIGKVRIELIWSYLYGLLLIH
jgi:hypothetical protein